MARTVLDVTTDLGATALGGIYNPTTNDAKGTVRRFLAVLNGALAGVYTGVSVNLRSGAVPATATLTFTGAPVADETFIVAGATFTAKAAGATGDQFNIGGSVTATAENVVAAVNASATKNVKDVVLASNVAGVVTFTAKVAGVAGNGLVLTESLTNATRVDFASGSDGTLYSSLAIS